MLHAQHTYEALQFDTMQRLMQYKKAWEAYGGRMHDILKTKPGQPNDNVKLNYLRLIVDKGVSFLFGKPIAFELDSLEEVDRIKLEDMQFSRNTEEEEWLRKVWRKNRQGSLLLKLAVNGAICGTAFVKIVLNSRVTGKFPRLVILDPETVEVESERDDLDDVFRFRISWKDVDRRTGKAVLVCETHERDEAGTWWIWEEEQDLQSGVKRLIREKEAWPYSWPAISFCQNLPASNQLYGTSDLEGDILSVGHSLNFVLSNMNRILRYHAHPKTWGRGFTAKSLEIAPDETIILPDAEAALENLEMRSDLGSSVEYYRQLKKALHELARIPEISVGSVENLGPIAGVALGVLYQPLLEKTETKRTLYGELLSEVNGRLLEIGGYGLDLEVKTHWPQLLPRDALQERQAAQIDKQLGVTEDTLQAQLGYDPALERAKKARETPTPEPAKLEPVPENGIIAKQGEQDE